MFSRRREEERPVFVGVCVNTAAKKELMDIRGIGESTADAIISGRPWTFVGELASLRGVTDASIVEWGLFIT